jgi:hypothetical protein
LNKDCKILSESLSDFAVIETLPKNHPISSGGLWGKPSATVFDINGQLKWKKESGFDAMGKNAVLDEMVNDLLFGK